MATVAIPSDLQRYTDGMATVEVAAQSYRDLVSELLGRFPGLTEEVLRKQAIAIDGRIITEPLLETFSTESKLVFFAKIAGG